MSSDFLCWGHATGETFGHIIEGNHQTTGITTVAGTSLCVSPDDDGSPRIKWKRYSGDRGPSKYCQSCVAACKKREVRT